MVVKLGLHFGPAIAVNANDLLDYFGQTVNIAARLQRESEGGDLVMVASALKDEAVNSILNEFSAKGELFVASLRGLEGQMELVRIRPDLKKTISA